MAHAKLIGLTLTWALMLIGSFDCHANENNQILPAREAPTARVQDLAPDDGRASRERRQADSIIEPIAAGFLAAGRADIWLDGKRATDSKLGEVLARDGPDMRPSRDYKDFKDITMEVSQRAWRMYHDRVRSLIGGLVKQAGPVWEEVLREARVSNKCFDAMRTLESEAINLRSWAVKMLNSWGHFPMSGLFEGTYGDVGAFHTCVKIHNVPQPIGHAHYCSVAFRPVMPSRDDYDLIVRHEPSELVEMFERRNNTGSGPPPEGQRDALSDILEHAQYHHFVYYKWGTCWPIDCSPFDVRRVAKLVARRNILMNGPVKCYSLNRTDYEQPDNETLIEEHWNGGVDNWRTSASSSKLERRKTKLEISIWDRNNGIFIWKPHFKTAQKVALGIILTLIVFISLMSLIDLFANRIPRLWKYFTLSLRAMPLTNGARNNNSSATIAALDSEPKLQNTCDVSLECRGLHIETPTGLETVAPKGFSIVPTREQDPIPNGRQSFFMSIVDDCSLFTNVPQFFRVSEGQMKNDILCLNGIRCITMAWIIMTHTMMYNDWSAFARTKEVEVALNSLISQPLFNGSYLVDTFFLMSGLLSAFTAFRHSQGIRAKFNSFAFIFNRWLRLTPQIFIVSMIYIVFPALSYGPHWFPITGEYSENCVKNWWINVLHMQAFYKKEEMCNFVTWWISIDFFYHFFALAVIWVILLGGHKLGFTSMSFLVCSQIIWQSIRHYSLRLPPNVLSTIPQTGAMWTTMTLDFFWTPYTHSVPFFFGFYIGYLMALKQKLIMKNLNTRRALIGWILSVSLLLGQSYSTYWWVTGKAGYSALLSTMYYGACSIIWAGSLCWIIIACHHGYGGFVNRVLSWKLFIVLGKASYLVYLSHFQVLFVFFGNQNILVEPTTIVMLYMIFGNIFVSTLWGVFLCSIFELPWLKAHRRLMKYV